MKVSSQTPSGVQEWNRGRKAVLVGYGRGSFEGIVSGNRPLFQEEKKTCRRTTTPLREKKKTITRKITGKEVKKNRSQSPLPEAEREKRRSSVLRHTMLPRLRETGPETRREDQAQPSKPPTEQQRGVPSRTSDVLPARPYWGSPRPRGIFKPFLPSLLPCPPYGPLPPTRARKTTRTLNAHGTKGPPQSQNHRSGSVTEGARPRVSQPLTRRGA